MANISIDFDPSKNEIYLLGDIKALQKHRFAWRYARDYLNPTIEAERIVIPVGDNEPYVVMSNISSMLAKYGFIEDQSKSTEQVVIDYYEEERRFKEFSEKALNIRNNECDTEEFAEFTKSVAENLPSRSLYPLQLLSAYHMAFSQNACNFSVPGAGKTSIVYGAYAYLHNLPEDNPKHVDQLLIVGPLSSFGPWETEFEECFGRAPHSKRLVGGVDKADKQDYLILKHPFELTLISYASLISLQKEIGFFLRTNRVMVVLDEAHKAKNSSGGIIAQAVLEMSKYSKSRIVLTGTPAPNGYEDMIAKHCKAKRKLMSLEKLKEQLENNERAGEIAELFVVEYEKRRLGIADGTKVKRISDIDVSAGYDIVSVNTPEAVVSNRFIEVKAVSTTGFFWSKNEYAVAKLLGTNYYLYLVDLTKISDNGYSPEIVNNPAQEIMENCQWLIEPQSYHIQKVDC